MRRMGKSMDLAMGREGSKRRKRVHSGLLYAAVVVKTTTMLKSCATKNDSTTRGCLPPYQGHNRAHIALQDQRLSYLADQLHITGLRIRRPATFCHLSHQPSHLRPRLPFSPNSAGRQILMTRKAISTSSGSPRNKTKLQIRRPPDLYCHLRNYRVATEASLM